MSFSAAGGPAGQGLCQAAGKWSSPDRGDSPRRDDAGRDGFAAAPGVNRLIVVTGDRHELIWHEPICTNWPRRPRSPGSPAC
jgi:hypothetical protein